MAALMPASSDAAIITQTYDIDATGFLPLSGSTPAPIDPVHLSVSVTFDNAADITDQSTGVVLHNSNLPVQSAIGLTYLAASDTLLIGGLVNMVGLLVGFTDDWAVNIADASTAAPQFTLVVYTASNAASGWYTYDGSVTVPPSPGATVPEPPVLAMLPVGLLLLGGLARLTARREADVADPGPAVSGA